MHASYLLSSFRLDVRAMPFPRTTASSGDDSFNTERLDEQNSAENIRSSMQKYLQVGGMIDNAISIFFLPWSTRRQSELYSVQ